VLEELDPVDRLTAGAVGPPGQRVFYVQGRRGTTLVTVGVEKQQLELLAAWVIDMLYRVGSETGEGPPEEEMNLEEPIEARWRAGRLSLGYEEDRDMMFLEVEEVVESEGEEEEQGEEEEDETDEPLTDPNIIRFWATREQMMALARHGAAVCAAGRPRCQFCGGPIDPEGHVCPALDGHREIGEA
jgi:uncharacterized repeat protein (TIGR03847 family)